MNLKIQNLSFDYLDEITELDKKCFKLNWSKALFESELNSPNARYLIALNGEKLIGYCGIQTVAGEGNITNVAVLPEYRKQGIATRLIEEMISYGNAIKLDFITLEVRESNTNAIKLYEKFGFEKVGARKNYYSDNKETALLMTKQL